MKTKLIVETNLDDLRETKNKIVDHLSNIGNLKSWGDDSIETHDGEVYFLKVVSSSEYKTKLLSIIGKGYDDIKIDSVIDEIKRLLLFLYDFIPSDKEDTPKIDTEAQNDDISNDSDEDEVSVVNEEKNTEKVDSDNKNEESDEDKDKE